jgi:hypothetical protein
MQPTSTRQQQDADLTDALMRILKSPLGKPLRDKLKDIINGHSN